ncbi:hypothetical protein M5689_003079 [Euphorbia peplus]|nr:hypothetical protein M5689_003079 [Euphorbia peplus]
MAMAGIDPKKQLLTLIRDCASEKTQGERRLVGLKKRIEELRTQLEGINAEKEESKSFKETTEQELKGCEVELAMHVASIQTLEARISQFQDHISSIGSEVEHLKNEERISRDQFIGEMFELNNQIRKFQEKMSSRLQEGNTEMTPAVISESDREVETEVLAERDLRNLEDLLADLVSRTTEKEHDYVVEQNLQKELQQEYVDLQKKVSLVETSELELDYDSLGGELQRRCVCPSCCTDNIEFLGGILQLNAAN